MANNKNMKTTSETLRPIWEELKDIFFSFKKMNAKTVGRLEKLGYEVKFSGNHYKVFIELGNKKEMILISSSPSDTYAGSQILQDIRRAYERYDGSR